VDDPYEPPLHPEVTVPTHLQTVQESLDTIWDGIVGRP
jgi:adenylylsulfate kinase-like enzyme